MVSHSMWQRERRKRIFNRAKELKIEPKLSPKVKDDLRELYEIGKEA